MAVRIPSLTLNCFESHVSEIRALQRLVYKKTNYHNEEDNVKEIIL